MIRPLRSTHRVLFLFLPALLAAILVVGITSRYPWAASRRSLAPDMPSTAGKVVKVGDATLEVQVLRSAVDPEELRLRLFAKTPLAVPDLLIYWSESPAKKALPSDARFLGSYGTAERYSVPAEAQRAGYLDLYSLAHREVLASVPMAGQP